MNQTFWSACRLWGCSLGLVVTAAAQAQPTPGLDIPHQERPEQRLPPSDDPVVPDRRPGPVDDPIEDVYEVPPAEKVEVDPHTIEGVPPDAVPLDTLLPIDRPLIDPLREAEWRVAPLRERLVGEPWTQQELRMPIQDFPPDAPQTEAPLPFTGTPEALGGLPTEAVPGAPIEITVWGPAAVRQARAAVVREMQTMGYTATERGGGLWVFSPPQRWMGRVRLEPDGRLTFLRPVVAFRNLSLSERAEVQDMQRPGMVSNPNLEREPGGVLFPGPDGQPTMTMPPVEGWVWILPSMSRLRPIREQVLQRAQPHLEVYRQVRQNTLMMDRMADVQVGLRALWNDGVPIHAGRGTLKTAEERRRDALQFWATRLDSPEGLLITEAVEDWLRTVVMRSGDPVTPAEVRWAEALRADGRKLGPRLR